MPSQVTGGLKAENLELKEEQLSASEDHGYSALFSPLLSQNGPGGLFDPLAVRKRTHCCLLSDVSVELQELHLSSWLRSSEQ